MRGDAVASALPTALLVGGEVGQAWSEFLWTVRSGQPSRMTGLMDLYMMSVFGGRGRTGVELRHLLKQAGFTTRSLQPMPGRMSLIEAVGSATGSPTGRAANSP